VKTVHFVYRFTGEQEIIVVGSSSVPERTFARL